MTIGEKIQFLRKENKLSQEEFAERLGVSRQAISKWELGDSIPDVDKIKLISKLFNISTDSIILDTVDVSGNIIECDVPLKENKFKATAKSVTKSAKQYVFIIGYILIVFGIIYIAFSATLSIIWNGFSKELSGFLIQYNISLNLQFLFWIFVFMAIIAVIIMTIGIIIVVKAKKAAALREGITNGGKHD